MKKILGAAIAGLLALFSTAACAQYQVISPFPPFSLLSATQGGTQLDATQQPANYALVTTGNSQTPWAFALLPAIPGSVTTVSCATANGFACTTATPTTTPVLTLKTSVTGITKGNGTALSAAVAGTDYAPATSGASILYGNGAGAFSNVTIGSGVSFAGGTLSATGSGGTVTSASVVSANGLSGSVATPTTTPAITLTTSVNGIAKGDGTALSAAVAGTDYAPATSGSSLLAGNGAGSFATPTAATIGAPILATTTTPVTAASATPVSSGLSITVTTGATYSYEVFYYIASSSTASVISLNFGSATMTSITGAFLKQTTNVPNGVTTTAIASYAATSSGTVNVVGFSAVGTFIVSSGGTFIPGFATAIAATDTLAAGSWMRLTRIN